MATTSPDNVRSPNPTDPYNLVADLAILASDVQTALTRRANMYVGTSTQRTAFTTAPEGVHWQDTNGTRLEYVRQSGAWVNAVPQSNVLWSSATGFVMNESQTITFSEPVANQRTGLIFVWAARDSDAENQSVVVTKEQVLSLSGTRMIVANGATILVKFINTTNTSASGISTNTSGDRNNVVLRRVIGF